MNLVFWTIIDIIIYNVLSIYSFKHLNINNHKFNATFIWIIILFFCIFPLFSGDWIHYADKINYYYHHNYTDLEPIYLPIIEFTEFNYIFFRFIIWGCALIFLKLLFSRLKIFETRTLLIFIIWGLLFYSYPRVSLGLSILFYGYSLLIKPINRKLISYALGILLIILSCSFHKSIISLAVIIPFTLFPITRKLVCLFIIGAFLGVYFINNYLLSLKDITTIIEGGIYFIKEANAISLGQQIVNFVLRIPIIVISVIIAYKVLFRKQFHLNSYIYKFLSYLILILLLSFVFFFSDISNLTLFYRTLYMAFIPLSIVLAALYKTRLNHTIRTWTYIAYIGENMWLFYTLLGHYNGSIQ